MRTTAILIMIIVCGVAGAIQMLPGDSSNVTIYRLDTELPENTEGICDLSGASVSSETEVRFEYYGDTLVRLIAEQRADWLRISNDTIWRVGADTRRENIRFAHGIPYLLPYRNADAGDSVRHSVFMNIDRRNNIAYRYSSHKGCGFILPGGDTISSTYCVETEMSDSAATMISRRWYAEGAIWPIVEQVIAHNGEEKYSSVNICPLDGQPRRRNAVKGMNDDMRHGDGSIYHMLAQLHNSVTNPSQPAEPIYDQPYTFTIDNTGITITGESAENTTARLFDAAGRQWHEGPATATIPTTHLPSGVYLLQVSNSNSTLSSKITINIR